MAVDVLEKIDRINDICLFVKDFDGSVKFFTEKFGLRLKRLQPDSKNANYAEFDFHGTNLTLWDKKGVCEVIDSRFINGEGHHFMIAVKVSGIETVDAIYDEFVKNGVTCIKAPETYPFGSRAAYFLDHEKNIWEIFAWLAGNGPGLLNVQN